MLALFLISLGIFYSFFKIEKLILKNYHYRESHSIHQGKVSRQGGFLIFISILIYLIFHQVSTTLLTLFLIFTPIAICAFVEDFYHNVNAVIRLVAIIVSSIIYANIFGPVHGIDIPFLSFLFENGVFLFIFTVLALTLITNSFNIIDGQNGLASFSFIFIIFSLVGLNNFDYEDSKIYLIILLPTFFFLILNFPFSNIFLGDFGAYLFGFLSSSLIISFFNEHYEIIRWNAVLIIIYPLTETIFTFFRRLFLRRSPFLPDNKHLHSLIYKKLFSKNTTKANPLTTIYLLPFMAYGPIFSIIFNDDLIKILFLIMFYFITYFLTYVFLHKN